VAVGCFLAGGAVVNAAIRLYSYVTVRPRADRKVILRSLDFGTEFRWDAPTGLPLEGPLALLQAMVNRAALDRGFELVTRTELPPASGLSSSASMGCCANQRTTICNSIVDVTIGTSSQGSRSTRLSA